MIDAIDVIEQQQQKGYVSWRRRIAMIIAEREPLVLTIPFLLIILHNNHKSNCRASAWDN